MNDGQPIFDIIDPDKGILPKVKMPEPKKLLIKFRACNDIEHKSGVKSSCLFRNWGRGCNLQIRKGLNTEEDIFQDCPFKDGRTLEITPIMEE